MWGDKAEVQDHFRFADLHDKSLSSGAKMSVRALGSACLYLAASSARD
jgi:hypothetical protein